MIVQQRRQQQEAARATTSTDHNHGAHGSSSGSGGGAATATGLYPSLSLIRRRSSVAKRGKGQPVKPAAAAMPDLTNLLETSGYGSYWCAWHAVFSNSAVILIRC